MIGSLFHWPERDVCSHLLGVMLRAAMHVTMTESRIPQDTVNVQGDTCAAMEITSIDVNTLLAAKEAPNEKGKFRLHWCKKCGKLGHVESVCLVMERAEHRGFLRLHRDDGRPHLIRL